MAECKICHKNFYSKQTRDRHVKVVHDEDPAAYESEDEDSDIENTKMTDDEAADSDSETGDKETEDEDEEEISRDNDNGINQLQEVICKAMMDKQIIDEEAWGKCQEFVMNQTELEDSSNE